MYENEILTQATFIHRYFLSSLVLTSIMLNNLCHFFFSTSSAASVAGSTQPGVHSCRDGENFVRASEQEESRATRKGHKKEDSRTL